MRKWLVVWVVVMLLLTAPILVLGASNNGKIEGIKEMREPGPSMSITRVPQDVYSRQPAFIFANVSNGYHNVTLDVTIEINRETSLPSIPPTPLSISYSTRMIPISRNYYVSGIPGLPNETFYIGNQPPTAEVTSPATGTIVSRIVTIQGSAYDPENNLNKVEVAIDDSSFLINTLIVSGTAAWSASWNTTQYINGMHTIWARSYDGELYSVPVSVAVMVDNAGLPPTPVVLAYTQITSSSVFLNWTQNLDADFDRYEVHKSTIPDFTPSSTTLVSTIPSQTTTQYNVTGLTPLTTFYFKVRVYDDEGLCSDSNEISATTPPVTNQPPTASFTYTPSSPTTADIIQFTDTSTDPDGTIVAWAWDFGDATGSTTQNPTHRYTVPGTYVVTLTVSDNQGATASTSKTISVSSLTVSVNVTVDNIRGTKSPGDYITFYSVVTYSVNVDGMLVRNDSYIVKAGKAPQLSPIVYAMDYSVLTDPSLLYETLGLGPKGWALNENTTFKSLILALDDKGLTIDNLTFFYNVNDLGWNTLPVYLDTLIGILNSTIGEANHWVDLMNEWLQLRGFKTLPPLYSPLLIAYAEIPGQNAGSYVRFYANATDFDNNTFSSPTGFYYVDKELSSVKILVVDPNFYLWFVQENIMHFANVLREKSNYQLPGDLMDEYVYAKKIAELVQKYGIVPFRHWEYLGEYYDIYIVRPEKNLPDFLESFEPNVIFLSNIWLGFRRLSSNATGPWNWDLKDLDVQDDLIEYVKTNHSALIATHGTLSDWTVWFDNTPENQYKVCTKGHIGNTTAEFNPVYEKTLAAMLGMPELTLWEWTRDEIANYLCELGKEMMKSSDPYTAAVGAAIYASGLVTGSTPLQVPYVPFDGEMRKTPEAQFVGWEIPENFSVEIPLVRDYTNSTFNATTQVGWQLAMPRSIAYAAWWKAEELRPYAQMLYDRLTRQVQNVSEDIISRANLTERLDDALGRALRSFYKNLISANITGTTFNFTLNLSQINETLNRTIDILLDVAQYGYNLILQFIPVRLVALSPNCLAGIITYDKYFDPNGYRSVYFSFEPEAAKGAIAKTLLKEAVEWARNWQYKNITELLGDLVRVEKEIANRFKENMTTTLGTWLRNETLVLNEEGNAIIDLSLQSGGVTTLIVAHPTANEIFVEILSGSAEIINKEKLMGRLTKIELKAHATGEIKLGFRAGSDTSLNPVYLSIKEYRSGERYLIELTPAGGTITAPYLKIEIPPGASSIGVTITTKEITITPPRGCQVVGKVYRIESTIATFAKPVQLTLSYNDTELPEGADESKLAIWRKSGDKWERLGGEVDPAKNTVTVEVTGFSEYAIFYGEPIKEERPLIAFLRDNLLLVLLVIIVLIIIGCAVAVARKRKK